MDTRVGFIHIHSQNKVMAKTKTADRRRLRQAEEAEPRLGAFLSEQVKRRIDVKPATKEVWSQVVRNLVDCFGHGRELATQYPLHVVRAWIGNTPRVARKHYLMVTDADFAKAAGEPDRGALQKAMQNDDQSAAKSDADDGGPCLPVSPRNDATPFLQWVLAVVGSYGPELLAERTGFEPAEDL